MNFHFSIAVPLILQEPTVEWHPKCTNIESFNTTLNNKPFVMINLEYKIIHLQLQTWFKIPFMVSLNFGAKQGSATLARKVREGTPFLAGAFSFFIETRIWQPARILRQRTMKADNCFGCVPNIIFLGYWAFYLSCQKPHSLIELSLHQKAQSFTRNCHSSNRKWICFKNDRII